MAKISVLTPMLGSEVELASDLLCIVDTSEGETKNILVSEIGTILGGVPGQGGGSVTVENGIATSVVGTQAWSWPVYVGAGTPPTGPVSGPLVLTVVNGIASFTLGTTTYSFPVYPAP